MSVGQRVDEAATGRCEVRNSDNIEIEAASVDYMEFLVSKDCRFHDGRHQVLVVFPL
jgi:hypothetical protein